MTLPSPTLNLSGWDFFPFLAANNIALGFNSVYLVMNVIYMYIKDTMHIKYITYA